MELLSCLRRLTIGTTLSSDEKDLALCLLNVTNLDEFLGRLREVDYVITPLPVSHKPLLNVIMSKIDGESVEFPLPAGMRYNFYVSDAVRHMSSLVSGLISKIFKGTTSKVRGVISVAVGAGMDEYSAPGPAILLISQIPGIMLKFQDLTVTIGMAFTDSHTHSVTVTTVHREIKSEFSQTLSAGMVFKNMNDYLILDGSVTTEANVCISALIRCLPVAVKSPAAELFVRTGGWCEL